MLEILKEVRLQNESTSSEKKLQEEKLLNVKIKERIGWASKPKKTRPVYRGKCKSGAYFGPPTLGSRSQ